MERERARAFLEVLWDEAVRLLGVQTVMLMAERIQWDLEPVYPEVSRVRFRPERWDLNGLMALERGPEVAARMAEAFLTLYSNLLGEASAQQLKKRMEQALAGRGEAEQEVRTSEPAPVIQQP